MANDRTPNGVNGHGTAAAIPLSTFNGSAAAALEKGVPIGVAMSGNSDGEVSYRSRSQPRDASSSQNMETASMTSGQTQFGGNAGIGLPDFFSQEVRMP